MPSLLTAVKNNCLEQGFDRTYWLAFSGGLDSTVLLHLLVSLRSLYPIRLQAVHIHHGLSPNADRWVEHCEKICHEWAVEIISCRVNALPFRGQSPEESARKSRYDRLVECMAPGDILLTAHHQDDQAETILMQLFRGAGPKGLAAMSPFSPYKQGYHARPLLEFSREKLEQYAKEHQLTWVDDESNTDKQFTRNFIRHDMMTLLKSRWPGVMKSLARSAKHCAETQELVEALAYQDLVLCHGEKPGTLSVKKILQFNEARQRQVLRLWLSKNNFSIPSTVKMHHIIHDLLHAGFDKSPHILWDKNELRRYRDDIYVMSCLTEFDSAQRVLWGARDPLILPGVGVLHANVTRGRGLRVESDQVVVQFRRGGESCHLPGRTHHHSLKKLFQDWGVPPWQRDRTPLIFINDQLASAVGFFVAEEFTAKELEQGVELTLLPASES